jgi:pimeloyl-ACP methyl ester carboxylesterase
MSTNNSTIRNVVLVHSGFVDGSGWEGVSALLTRRGYNVSIVQNPTTSLAADVAATNQILDEQDGDVVLVGHSYGGVVITEAGRHPKVKRLVYITAFAPDAGESVSSLIANPPARRTSPADPAAEQRLPLPRQGQICRLVRRRCRASKGGLHGAFAGTVGSGCPAGCCHRPGLEEQAQLLSGGDAGRHDPAAGPTDDGGASWRYGP